MLTRTRAVTRWRAILLAALVSAAINVPAKAASFVGITDFRGAWASTASYATGTIVTYNGASYICVVANRSVIPNGSATDWALLDLSLIHI